MKILGLTVGFDTIVGLIAVVVFAHHRFSRPAKTADLKAKLLTLDSRNATTDLSFFGALFVYIAGFVVLFFSIQAYDPLFRVLLESLKIQVPKETNQLAGSSPALFAALVLTGLVQTIPPLSAAEIKIREVLQRLASIPKYVMEEINLLESLEFDKGAIADYVTRSNDNWLSAHIGSKAVYSFVKCSVIMDRLRAWKKTEPFSDFAAAFKEVHDSIEADYVRLENSLGLYKEASLQLSDEHRVPKQLDKQLLDESANLQRLLYEFIAVGLLRSAKSDSDQTDEILRLGFRGEKKKQPILAPGQVCFIALLTWLLAFAPLMFFVKGANDSLSHIIRFAFTIATSIAVSVTCAVVAWRRASTKLNVSIENRPWHRYLWAGIVAGSLGLGLDFMIRTAFITIMHSDVHELWPRLVLRAPWQIITASLCGTLACLLDNNPTPLLTEKRLRMVEGAVTLVMITFMCWVTEIALQAVTASYPGVMTVPHFLQIFAVVGPMALFLGMYVPSWGRRIKASGV